MVAGARFELTTFGQANGASRIMRSTFISSQFTVRILR